MITEKKIKQAFYSQSLGIAAFLTLFEALFYLNYLYFKESISIESNFIIYLMVHMIIAVTAAMHFTRKALTKILIQEDDEKN